MENVREIFRSFSQTEGFDGWVIGKLCFWCEPGRYRTKRKHVSVRKQKKNYAVLELTCSDLRAEMHLLKLQEGILEEMTGDRGEEQKKFPGQKGRTFVLSGRHILLGVRTFSREDVLAFVDDVGDGNQLHRTEKPVVPGGMIVEWLWEGGFFRQQEVLSGTDGVGEKGLSSAIEFQSPAYAGEETVVYQDGRSGQFLGIAFREGMPVLLWKWKRLDCRGSGSLS